MSNPPLLSPFPPDEFIFHPQPPPPQQSDSNFSPLIIALIGILASAFLLVSYYTVIAKYCTKWEAFRPRVQADHEIDPSPMNASWPVITHGLEESVIRSIPVFKYKAGDWMVDDTECAVCLSEFQQDESLRLLPKCTHAFHVACIDMWLSSHSNCPLCRANIVNSATPTPTEVEETVSEENTESTVDSPFQEQSESEVARESSEEESGEGMVLEAPPALLAISHIRAQSDLLMKHGRSISQSRKLLSEMQQKQAMKRSYSVDSSQRLHVSITDLLAIHLALEDGKLRGPCNANEARVGVSGSGDLEDGKSLAFCSIDEAQVGTSSSVQFSNVAEEHNLGTEMSCASSKVMNKQFYVDRNKSTMRRSFSGGKFFFFKNSRGRNAPILPS